MCDVVKSNFSELYPTIKESIKKATFISIDTEFTGLKIQSDDRPSLFDTGNDRYRKLRDSIQAFSLSQIGVATFHAMNEEIRGPYYEVHSYNCYIYPRSFGPLNRRFQVQASSFEFMCKHKFDFNKYIYEGVSFVTDDEEEELDKYINNKARGFTDSDVDEKLIQEYCSTVADWLVTSPESSIQLTIIEDVPEFILHTEIRDRFSNVWTYEKDGEIVIKKVSEEERKKLHQEHLEEQRDKVRDQMLGFTKVFRDLVAAKKPIVGHNNLMDLMFIYDKFYKPLPMDYGVFKTDIHRMFPLVFDTKNIVSNIKRDPVCEESGLFFRDWLGVLYTSLNSKDGMFCKLHAPVIVHHKDSKRYEGIHHEHEAGFDAFMCGYVFLRMAHIYTARNLTAEEVRPLSFSEYISAMKPYANCINMIRASIDHMCLSGPDPESRRPQLLHISSKTQLHQGELVSQLAKHGSVDVQMQSSRIGVVAAGNHRCAKDIMKSFTDHPTIRVTTYNTWKHSPVVRKFMWSGLFVTGSICLWTLYSGLKPKSS